jgi:hypothetical protein
MGIFAGYERRQELGDEDGEQTNRVQVSHIFASGIQGGQVGLRVENAHTHFQEVALKRLVNVTQYYYLGGQRVALRRDGGLTYLLADHPSRDSPVPRRSWPTPSRTVPRRARAGSRETAQPGRAVRPPGATLQEAGREGVEEECSPLEGYGGQGEAGGRRAGADPPALLTSWRRSGAAAANLSRRHKTAIMIEERKRRILAWRRR